MPESTQMHVQWITVNGQSVPLVLPQYWDGEKWVISSEQNPLPVKAELTGGMAEIPGAAKVEEVTVIDAESIAAQDSILITDGIIPRKNYHELWLALAIDQQPWRMRFRSFLSTALSSAVFFPEPNNKTTTHTLTTPFMALYHRFPFPEGIDAPSDEIQNPNNLTEAKEIIMPYQLGEALLGRVYNDSDELATVTLKAIMIWR